MPWKVPHLPHPVPEAPSRGDPGPHVLSGQQALPKQPREMGCWEEGKKECWQSALTYVHTSLEDRTGTLVRARPLTDGANGMGALRC